jgi:hypothetical protein
MGTFRLWPDLGVPIRPRQRLADTVSSRRVRLTCSHVNAETSPLRRPASPMSKMIAAQRGERGERRRDQAVEFLGRVEAQGLDLLPLDLGEHWQLDCHPAALGAAEDVPEHAQHSVRIALRSAAASEP